MLLFGLGSAASQAAMQSTYNTSLVHGGTGTVADPKHAGGFTIQQHTWDQVINEIYPGWLSDYHFKTNISETLLIEWRERVRAKAATLPGCPAGSITDNGASCYFGRYTPLTTWNVNDPVEFLPPGVFAVYAIPFSADELKNGRFTRTLVPSPIQRRDAEWAIIRMSGARLFGKPVPIVGRPVFGDTNGLIWKSINAFKKAGSITFPGSGSTATITAPQIRAIAEHPSVDQMLAMCPDIMLFSINFQRNPIQPTQAERTQADGWQSWLGRGGYPLSRAVVTGRSPTATGALGIQFCEGLSCACPSTANNGFPSCKPAGFTRDGIGHASGEGAFHPYIAIPQDAVKPELQLTLVHDDPAWIQKIGLLGEKFMRLLGDAACANQGYTKQQMAAQAAAEQCVDAAKKPCAKGSPGCVCTKPSASQQGAQISANVIYDVAMAKFCPGWIMDGMPPPVLPDVDPNPPVPPPPSIFSKIPWWLVVLGGVGVGAYAFSRK